MRKVLIHNLTFKGIEVVPGVLNFDQRGIIYAGPGDIVVTKSIIDPEYLNYLQELGWDFTDTKFVTPQDLSDYKYNSVFQTVNLKEYLKDGEFLLDTYNVTPAEEDFAKRNNLPFFSRVSVSGKYGTKSGFRKLCKELNLPVADGAEGLKNTDEVLKAIKKLSQKGCREVAIKIDEGVSGAGITKLDTTEFFRRKRTEQKKIISEAIVKVSQAGDNSGVTVEEWVQDIVASPSVQVEVYPDKSWQVVSMHDQLLEGAEKWYVGCMQPVQSLKGRLRKNILKQVEVIIDRFIKEGFMGALGIDLILTKDKKHYFVEANMRKTGTYYPRVIAEKVNGGSLDGVYYIARDFTVPIFTGLSFTEVKTTLEEFIYPISDSSQLSTFSQVKDESSLQDSSDMNNESLEGLEEVHTQFVGLKKPIAFEKKGIILYNTGVLKEAGRFDVVCLADSKKECRKLYLSLKKKLQNLQK